MGDSEGNSRSHRKLRDNIAYYGKYAEVSASGVFRFSKKYALCLKVKKKYINVLYNDAYNIYNVYK